MKARRLITASLNLFKQVEKAVVKPLQEPVTIIKTDGHSGVGNKNTIQGSTAQEVTDLVLGIVQISFTGLGGIAD